MNGTRYDSELRQQVVKTLFVSVQGWGPVAAEMLSWHKGDEVYLVGELDQYKKEGADRPSTRVTIFSATVLRESAGSGARAPAQEQADPWA